MKTTLKVGLLIGYVLFARGASAALCSRTYNFTDGSVLTAAQLNTEFNAAVDCSNSLSDANLSSSAGIDPKKISASIAGSGLSRDSGTGALTPSVDGSTIEVSSNSLQVKDNSISDAKLRQSAGLSVVGRSANSTGNVADIASSVDGQVLRRSGTSLGFGTVATAGITDSAVTTAKINDSAVTTAKLNDSSVTTAKINNAAVTLTKMAARPTGTTVAAYGVATSASTGLHSSSSTSYGSKIVSVVVTTTGHPVFVGLIPDGLGDPCYVTAASGIVMLDRDEGGLTIGEHWIAGSPTTGCGMIWTIDFPAAGAHSYNLYARVFTSGNIQVRRARLVAFEL